MPQRVSSRRQFERLARPDSRGRSGPIKVSYVESSEPSEQMAVAYAISTAVGPAVVRNKIRRRLRAAMDERRERLREGMYLIRCDIGTGQLDYDQLRTHLERALDDASTLT